jgi:Right handed beta helix region
VAGLAALYAFAAPTPGLAAGTITVTNTNSSGSGSLRDAINTSNRRSGKQTIEFSIGSGKQVITPLTDLPQITDKVTIDGYTQPGSSAATASAGASPKILIDGRNLNVGLDIESSKNTVRGLVIQNVPETGVLQAAVYIGSGSENVIAGNYLGTNAPGKGAKGNFIGVLVKGEGSDNVIGGPDPADRNLISANTYGVEIDSVRSGNVVEGNRIGTNAGGTVALSSTAGDFDQFGVLLASSGSTVKDNLIANMSDGVEVWGNDNTIQGNLIGTNADGTAAIPNNIGVVLEGGDGNLLGGKDTGEGNVISGSKFEGVSIEPGDLEAGFDGGPAIGTIVRGNKIGTNLAGTGAIPNDTFCVCTAGISVVSGPTTIGGSGEGAENIISGNAHDGLSIVGSGAVGTQVSGNLIGTDLTGTLALANASSGVSIGFDAKANSIGGASADQANTIAHNGADGVTVASGAGNAILRNSITDNGALGIDLEDDGVTLNDAASSLDADAGANALQNFPVITSATVSGTQTSVDWTLDSRASRRFRIEFFGATCDGSGYGEGETYLGSTTVTTNALGHASNTTNVTTPAAGQLVTATATATIALGSTGLFDLSSTSEFSACAVVS